MRDEFAEPVKVAGKHRIIGGACVDCGKPLADGSRSIKTSRLIHGLPQHEKHETLLAFGNEQPMIKKMAQSIEHSSSPEAQITHWQRLYYEAVKEHPQVQIVWVVSRGMQDINGKAIRGGETIVIGVRSSRLLALELIEQVDCKDPVTEGYRDYSIEDATVDRGYVRGVQGFCDGTWKFELAAERSRQPQPAPDGAPDGDPVG